MKKSIFFICLLFSFIPHLKGQRIFFEGYSLKDGLESNYILDINQANNGLIVVSTYGGVSVLYPNGIKTYTFGNDTLKTYPTRLFALGENKIVINWLKGYSILNLSNGDIDHYTSDITAPIHTFAFGDDVVYTFEDSTNLENVHYVDPELKNAQITDIIREGDQLLFSTLDQGILSYSLENKEITKLDFPVEKSPVYSLKVINEEIYTISDRGFHILQDDQFLSEQKLFFEPFDNYLGLIREHEVDRLGNRWFAGQFTGVLKMSNGKISMLGQKNGFTSSKVSSIFKDREGNLWFGTLGQGLFMYRNDPFTLLDQTSYGLMLNNIGAIERSGNYLIVGYAPGGLEILDTAGMSLAYYSFYNSPLTDDNILLLKSIEEEVYGVAINQLFRVAGTEIVPIAKPDSLNFYRIRNMTAGDGNIYLSSLIGILKYNIKENKGLELYLAPSGAGEVFYVDYYKGKLFFTTADGVFMNSSDGVTSLLENHKEYLYAISSQSSSTYFTKEGDYVVVDKEEGRIIVNGTLNIQGMLQSVISYDGRIYLFTDGYFYIYKDDALISGASKKKAEAAGKHGYDIFPNSVKIMGQQIYLGTSEGIIRWSPDEVFVDEVAPSVVLQFPKNYETRKHRNYFVPVDARDKFFQIYAVDYKSGHQVTLTVANNEDINSSTNNYLELIGKQLNSGRNEMTITAIDPSGNKTVEQAVFYVEPYFYETEFFKALVVLLALAIVIYLYLTLQRNRERKLLNKEKNKREIEEKLRESIAMDFHDELGNNLAVLNVHIEKLNLKSAGYSGIEPILADIRTSYKNIFENSKDLVWALNPSSDDLSEIIVRGKDYGERLFRDSPIQFRCINNLQAGAGTAVKSSAAKDIMFIIKEGFTNAYKHSKASTVELIFEGDNLYHSMIIRDNGRGIPENPNAGRGLRYMKKRAERIGYKLHFDSSDGGTTINLEGKLL